MLTFTKHEIPILRMVRCMSYQIEDHFGRNIVIGAICLIVVVAGVMLYMQNLRNQKIDEGMKRWQAEHDLVERMNCEELREGMLYNKIKASDNKQRATERFLGMDCQP